jgi:hypothetical protein
MERFMKKYIRWCGLFLLFLGFVPARGMEARTSLPACLPESLSNTTKAYLKLFEPIHDMQSRKTLSELYAADGVYHADAEKTSLDEMNQRGKQGLKFLIACGFDPAVDLYDEDLPAYFAKIAQPIHWLQFCSQAARLVYWFLQGKEPSETWLKRYQDHTNYLIRVLKACGAEEKKVENTEQTCCERVSIKQDKV